MSFVDISLIFELMHAVNRCDSLRASECYAGGKYTGKQIIDGFDTLHRYGLIVSERVVDGDGDGITDYEVNGLTERGKQIYKIFLQTQLAFGDV
jgi:hypothetical protein